MLYKWIIVMTIYYFRANDFWDVKEVLVLEHSLVIFSAFWKTCCIQFDCYGYFVIVLQLKKRNLIPLILA